MHRRREKRREQRDAAVAAILDRIDATPSLAPPVPGWDVVSSAGAALHTGSALNWAALPGLDPAADALLKADRAERKRQQLESLLDLLQVHVLPHLAEEQHNANQRPLRFVDFACGSGHFGLLVASQVPNSQVTLVDMQDHGLEKARARADSLGLGARVSTCESRLPVATAGIIANDVSIGPGCGSIGDYQEDFDCALGLHSCGSLTDLILAQVRVWLNEKFLRPTE